MIVNGVQIDNIDLIRAKELADGRWELQFHPRRMLGIPAMLLPGSPATMVEIEIDASELKRLLRVAPHLFPDRHSLDRILDRIG